MAASQLELESLVTKILMDASDFLGKSKQVTDRFDQVALAALKLGDTIRHVFETAALAVAASTGEIVKSLAGVTTSSEGLVLALEGVGKAATGLSTNVASLTSVQTVIDGFTTSMTKLSSVAALLPQVSASLQLFSSGLAGMEVATKGLANVGKFLEGVEVVTISKIAQVAPELKKFSDEFVSFAASLATADTTTASKNLSRLGSLFDGIKNLKFNVVTFAEIQTALKSFFVDLTNLPMDKVDMVGKAMSRLASTINATAKVNLNAITSMGTRLKTLFTNISAIGPEALLGTNVALGRLASLMSATTRVDLDTITSMGTRLKTLFTNLAGIDPEAMSGVTGAFGRLASLMNAVTKVNLDNITSAGTRLKTLFTNLTNLDSASMEIVTGAFGRLNSLLRSMDRVDPTKITNIAGPLKAMFADLAAIGLATGMEEITKALGKVNNLLRTMDRVDPAKVVGLAGPLQQMFTDLASAGLAAGMEEVYKAMGRVNRLLLLINKVPPANVTNLAGPIKQMFIDLAGLATTSGLEEIGKAMGRFSSFLRMASKADVTKLKQLPVDVGDFFRSLGSVDTTAAMPVLSALNRYQSVVLRMSKVDLTNVTASAGVIKNLMASLASIPVTANLTNVVALLGRVGTAMRGIAAGSGGGGGGGAGFLSSLVARFGGLAPAMQTATSASQKFLSSIRGLVAMSGVAGTSLYGLQMTLMGFGALGIAMFAKLDDALVRTMANMRDWWQESRGALQQGVYEISGGSITGANELAKSLSTLTGSGMNATMAIDALRIAETFSVAGAVPMETATKRLVDVMNMMGLAVEDVAEHMYNLQHVSDLFVGMANRSGSSVDQLSAAFTGRFAHALHQGKVSMEEGIAILALYSRAGEQFRGQAGGSIAGRALGSVMKAAVENQGQWQHILDPDNVGILRDVKGELKPTIELLEIMNSKLAHLDQHKRFAQLALLGFSEPKTQFALEPLLGKVGAIAQMKADMMELGGISNIAAEMIRGSILSQMKILWNNVVNISTVIGDRLAPAIGAMSAGMQAAATWFTSLNDAFKNMIVYGLVTVGVLLGLGTIVGFVGSVVRGILIAPLLMVGNVLRLLAAPLMVFVYGFRILSAGLQMVYAGALMLGKGFVFMGSVVASVWKALLSLDWAEIGKTIKKVVFLPFTMLESAIAGIEMAIQGLVSGLAGAWQILVMVANAVQNTAQHGAFALRMFEAAAEAMVKGFVAAVPALISIVSWLAMIPVTIALAGPMIALIGVLFTAMLALVSAVVVSVWMTIKSVFNGVMAVGAKVWESFKTAAGDAFKWAADGADVLGGRLAKMWDGAKTGIANLFDNSVRFFTAASGFFWNFRENAGKIINWVGENWRVAFEDMGRVAVFTLENLVSNFKTVGGVLIDVMIATFKAIWTLVSLYAGVAFDAIAGQWDNILADMKTMVVAFVRSIIANFGVMFGLIKDTAMMSFKESNLYAKIQDKKDQINALEDQAEKYAPGSRTHDNLMLRIAQKEDEINAIKAELAKVQAEKGKVIDAGTDRLKGPMDFIKPGDFKTDAGGIGKMIEGANAKVKGMVLDPFLKAIGKTMLKGVEDIKLPWMADLGVKGPWKALLDSFNLGLPDDIGDQIKAKFEKALGVGGDGGEGEAGNAIGKGGPGNVFKQTSLTRTMLGGPVAEKLDYQQLVTLKNIDKNLALIIEARGWNAMKAPVLKD